MKTKSDAGVPAFTFADLFQHRGTSSSYENILHQAMKYPIWKNFCLCPSEN